MFLEAFEISRRLPVIVVSLHAPWCGAERAQNPMNIGRSPFYVQGVQYESVPR
jgi:hypothetical protein